ncbi:MAG TPA: hypothetical protein VF469_18735, partial [Kofleriaceae bacterium]
LQVGTVSVRVVAGSASSPVVGTEVTLLVNNTPRVARTDSAGRAMFPGLPVGGTVIAKVTDEDKAEHASEAFEIPPSGGMRVLITTKPWQGGGGAPFAGGAGGMPNPRQMSGDARAEQSDPAGTLTVRVTYDDFKDTPEGVPVALVGYSADDTTSCRVVNTDKAGRVQFADLDRSGGTSYFAMALLARNGGVDRLASNPVVLDSEAGVRMVLSGEKRDSKAPPVDDFGKLDPQVATPAGKVRVALEGRADGSAKVTVIDAVTHKVLAEVAPEVSPPDPSRIQGGSRFSADPNLPAGMLDVMVVGGPGQTEEPLKDIAIRVIAATSQDVTSGLRSVTGADGMAHLAVPAKEPQKAVVTVRGRELVSETFDVTGSGGRLLIGAQWDDTPRAQALLEVAAAQGQVVYAEYAAKGQHFRSMPFQLLEGAGSKVSVFIAVRTYFQFQLEADVEDELLAVRGRFEVDNYSWAPYRAGPDGLVVALPRGFKGAIVAEGDQHEVSVAPGEGLRIVRPIPPGRRQFHAAFSLPIEAGKASWALDLPMGAYKSQLAIKRMPGMSLQLPPGVTSEDQTVSAGTYAVLGPIMIAARQSMHMSIGGLPSRPLWRKWVQGIIGVLVIAVILAGIGFAIFGLPSRGSAEAPARASSEAQRQRLLDELVELERTGANPQRREQLLSELEQLWS